MVVYSVSGQIVQKRCLPLHAVWLVNKINIQPKGLGSIIKHLLGNNQAQEIYSNSDNVVLKMAVYFSSQGADVRISENCHQINVSSILWLTK